MPNISYQKEEESLVRPWINVIQANPLLRLFDWEISNILHMSVKGEKCVGQDVYILSVFMPTYSPTNQASASLTIANPSWSKNFRGSFNIESTIGWQVTTTKQPCWTEESICSDIKIAAEAMIELLLNSCQINSNPIY